MTRFVHAEPEPGGGKYFVLEGCTIQGSHADELKIVGMLLGDGGVRCECNLCRSAAHVEKAVGMMALPVRMPQGIVKAAQEIVSSNPSVEPFGGTGDDLDVHVAVGERETGVLAEVGADFGGHGTLLAERE